MIKLRKNSGKTGVIIDLRAFHRLSMGGFLFEKSFCFNFISGNHAVAPVKKPA